MIRRDYILRMIEQFIQALAGIKALKHEQRWNEAEATLDEEFKRLVGDGAQTVARLSETDLLARLVGGEPTQIVRHKTLALVALLKEAGDTAGAQGRSDESRDCYLKALHLLLETLAREDVFELPEFAPRVEMLITALAAPLPVGTHAMLMQHYERIGEFARAENALFVMLEADADNDRVREFGIGFYNRLLVKPDSILAEGGLPRAEVVEGMRELQSRSQKSG